MGFLVRSPYQEAHQSSLMIAISNSMFSILTPQPQTSQSCQIMDTNRCIARCASTSQFSYVTNYVAQWQREPAARKQRDRAFHAMTFRVRLQHASTSMLASPTITPPRCHWSLLLVLGNQSQYSCLSKTLQQTVPFCLGRTTTATSNNNKYSPIVTTEYLFSWKMPCLLSNHLQTCIKSLRSSTKARKLCKLFTIYTVDR